MIKYTIKTKKGLIGDLVTEWMTDREIEEFYKKHNLYIQELKEKGEYLQPIEIEVELIEDPLFDKKLENQTPTESYRFDIIDLRK